MTNWIPTDRTRGGYEPAEPLATSEYAALSIHNTSMVTPGSYTSPIGAITPPLTSIRPAPPQLDPVQLVPSPPPDIPTTGSFTSSTSTQQSTMNDGTAQVTTTTSTTESSLRFNNGVVDASIIPYMRRLDIDFRAVGLRPNRRVYFFFDDTNVTEFISLNNSIDIDDPPGTDTPLPGGDPLIPDINDDDNGNGNGGGDTVIANCSIGWSITGVPGSGQGWRRRDFRGRRRMRVRRRRRIRNPDRTFGRIRIDISGGFDCVPPGSIIRMIGRNPLFNVNFTDVRTGRLNPRRWFLTAANTANADLIRSTIVLDPQFRHLPNNWWGTDGSNTVIMLTHLNHPRRRRRRFRIFGWNQVNGWLTVQPDASEEVPGFSQNPFANIQDAVRLLQDGDENLGDAGVTVVPTAPEELSVAVPLTNNSGVYRTDESGSISGTFHMPGGTFFTGQKIFRIIDNVSNQTEDDATTTYAEYKWVAQGLATVIQDVVINSTQTNTTVVRVPNPPPPRPPQPPGGGGGGGGGNRNDPIAQSFYVEPTNYPQGMFLSSVDLFFCNKDDVQPVSIEIRPTVNGYPDSNFCVPGSKVTKQAAEVKISDLPDMNNASTKTNFKFANPVYLPPGEYALVVYSPSVLYEIYVSELGEKIIGSTNIVSEQPYTGSLFKSQNASTWDATQLEDMMFRINKCRFVPDGRAVMYSSSVIQQLPPFGMFPTPIDEIMVRSEQAVLPGTLLSYELASDSSNVFVDIPAGIVLIPEGGRKHYPSAAANTNVQEGWFKLAVNMSTENPDVSPVIWNERFGIAMFENQIDNAEPIPTNFKILSSGAGYTANTEFPLVFTGSGNGDAEIYAVSNSTGHIVDLAFDVFGSGFLSNTQISVSFAGHSTPTSNAVITLTSETDAQGGPAWCKYISRTVTLNEGFESADLRAYVTAFKPIGTGIYVYYKVRNNNDPEPFSVKPWVQMIQKEYLTEFSRSTRDYLEFEFSPFGEEEPFESISYTSGDATYNTFDQYAIKIVLTTDDTTKFPVLKDLRAIALPAVEIL